MKSWISSLHKRKGIIRLLEKFLYPIIILQPTFFLASWNPFLNFVQEVFEPLLMMPTNNNTMDMSYFSVSPLRMVGFNETNNPSFTGSEFGYLNAPVADDLALVDSGQTPMVKVGSASSLGLTTPDIITEKGQQVSGLVNIEKTGRSSLVNHEAPNGDVLQQQHVLLHQNSPYSDNLFPGHDSDMSMWQQIFQNTEFEDGNKKIGARLDVLQYNHYSKQGKDSSAFEGGQLDKNPMLVEGSNDGAKTMVVVAQDHQESKKIEDLECEKKSIVQGQIMTDSYTQNFSPFDMSQTYLNSAAKQIDDQDRGQSSLGSQIYHEFKSLERKIHNWSKEERMHS